MKPALLALLLLGCGQKPTAQVEVCYSPDDLEPGDDWTVECSSERGPAAPLPSFVRGSLDAGGYNQ